MKKIIVFIIIVIVIVLLCIKLPKNEDEIVVDNTDNEVINEIKEENVVQNTLENIVKQNTVTDNKIETNIVPQENVYEKNPDVGTTDKKLEAIKLVQNEWGEDSTVSFRCDSVTPDGEYIIAVVSTQTMSVKNYFRVNLENKTVEVDY